MVMKQNKTKIVLLMLTLLLVMTAALVGCGQQEAEKSVQQDSAASSESAGAADGGSASDGTAGSEDDESGESGTSGASELSVCFGDDGEPFVLHLYENDTAAAIARHVGTADWRLPIYHYDDYENWESMQYYDVPSSYEIPSNAEKITSAKAGEVYYSEPNRMILFYHDAEISAEYTKVGYFDNTEEFVAAVENNPVLEGWDTKIVLIQSIE